MCRSSDGIFAATDFHLSYLPARVRSLAVRELAIRFQDHDASGGLAEWLAVEDVEVDILDTEQGHRVVFHSRTGHAFDETFGAIDAIPVHCANRYISSSSPFSGCVLLRKFVRTKG